MKAINAEDLLLQQLRDLYSAETQQIDVLVAMMDGAGTQELRAVMALHLNQTINHLNRIEEICKLMRTTPRGRHCAALEVLSRQSLDILQDPVAAPFRDDGIMDFAQQIDRYEIAGYGASLQYANELGLEEASNLIGRTLSEEKEIERIIGEMAGEAAGESIAFEEKRQAMA
jgi:ferritin-like metal-binding protein YciE